MSGFAGWILKVIMDWLWGKISAAIALFTKIKGEQAVEHKKNAEVRDKLEKAETPEEIDEALKSVTDRWRN